MDTLLSMAMPKPLPKPMLARRTLERGWTVRKVWSVEPGAEDFEYKTYPQSSAVACELGDWGRHFGTNFSGRAVYRTEFFSAPGEAYLDLGKAGVCAEVILNGKKLPSTFFGPFRWAVTLEAGTNVLEVTVGNTLANALIPELERIGREFPPVSPYTSREREFYEKDDLSSGLIGPVRLDITKVTVPKRPLPSFRPGAVPAARRAELQKAIPASLDAARRWSAVLKERGVRELADGSFQKRRFFKRLELVSNLVANTSFRFRRGTESDFGHAERSLDDLDAFRRYLEKELDLWRSYPDNPAVKAALLNVRDFGAVGDGRTVENAAFERALAAVRQRHGQPTILTVPAGDYLFKGSECANLVLSGLTNFILRGESPECVRFICGTYDAESVRIDRCENVTVSGIQNRYVKPTFFQGEVVKADNEKGFIEATLDEGSLSPTDPAWTNHYSVIRGSLYHRDGRMDLDCPNAAFEFDADDMGNGKYRIHFSTRFTKRRYGKLKADRKFAIPNRDNRYGAMFFNESALCNFENVWVRQARSAAFRGNMMRNCSLIRCKVIPLDGMVMSSCSDSCICQTGMYLEGCEFRGMGDDGVNTQTSGGFVYARPSADSFVHSKSSAIVVPGLLVQFMDPATGEMLGNARIVRSEPYRWRGRTFQRVTLDRPMPDGVTTYDDLGRGPLSQKDLDQTTLGQGKVYATPTHFYIPNAWGVGSVISGCSFSTTRCAGFVLQNSNTLVENCRVSNVKTGFRINALGSFREGTPPQNVIVRDCSFSDIGEIGAIVFQALQNTRPTVSSMGFLRVENCAFSDVRGEVLSLNDASDSTFRGITRNNRPVAPRFLRNAENNDLGENPYGIAAHLLNRKEEMRVVDESLKMIADAGIGWIRIDLLWRWVQREKGGAFDFAKYDSLLDRMERYGLEPLFILCDPPRWARPMNRHLDDWRAFVKAVMERYGKRVKAVEVWNEPNADRFWNPFFDVPFSAAAYYVIHRAASEVIRETAPSVRISTAGFTGVPLDVMEEIYKLGGKDSFDIVSVHPYARPEPPEGDLDRRIIALRDLMTRYGDNEKPIWITEIGWPTPEVRMACPTVIGEGLRQAWPEKKTFRIAYCGIEPETEDPTGSLLAEVRGVLPDGSRVVNVPPSELAGVLSRREVDVVMYPLCDGRFATGTFAAVTNFVAQGGTLILPGNLPLQTPMKRGTDGRFVSDPSVNNGTARKSVRLGWNWISDANGKKVRAKFAPARGTADIRMKTPQRWNDFCSGPVTLNEKFLKPGDRMIPLLTAEIDGRQIVGAAVYRFGSDWKGAVIATTVENERGAFTEAEQASRLKRAAALAFACSVEKFFVYEFMAPEDDPVYRESHYGIVHPDLTPKPAFEAYRDFIRHVRK